MEGVVDETQLKERIVVTGAEVSIIFLLPPYECTVYPLVMQQVNIIGAGWAEQLHMGRQLCYRRRRQVDNTIRC